MRRNKPTWNHSIQKKWLALSKKSSHNDNERQVNRQRLEKTEMTKRNVVPGSSTKQKNARGKHEWLQISYSLGSNSDVLVLTEVPDQLRCCH
jgi:hypothetical protein